MASDILELGTPFKGTLTLLRFALETGEITYLDRYLEQATLGDLKVACSIGYKGDMLNKIASVAGVTPYILRNHPYLVEHYRGNLSDLTPELASAHFMFNKDAMVTLSDTKAGRKIVDRIVNDHGLEAALNIPSNLPLSYETSIKVYKLCQEHNIEKKFSYNGETMGYIMQLPMEKRIPHAHRIHGARFMRENVDIFPRAVILKHAIEHAWPLELVQSMYDRGFRLNGHVSYYARSFEYLKFVDMIGGGPQKRFMSDMVTDDNFMYLAENHPNVHVLAEYWMEHPVDDVPPEFEEYLVQTTTYKHCTYPVTFVKSVYEANKSSLVIDYHNMFPEYITRMRQEKKKVSLQDQWRVALFGLYYTYYKQGVKPLGPHALRNIKFINETFTPEEFGDDTIVQSYRGDRLMLFPYFDYLHEDNTVSGCLAAAIRLNNKWDHKGKYRYTNARHAETVQVKERRANVRSVLDRLLIPDLLDIVEKMVS